MSATCSTSPVLGRPEAVGMCGCLSRPRKAGAHTCISQTFPALPTTLLILIPIEPVPVAIDAAVVVAVLLVDVANVVAVDPIDIPDIVPMSIPDISILAFLTNYQSLPKKQKKRVGCMVCRLPPNKTGGIKVKGRRDLVDRDKDSGQFPFPRSCAERTVWTACNEKRTSNNGPRQKRQERERAARRLCTWGEIEDRMQKHSPSCSCSEMGWRVWFQLQRFVEVRD